MSMDQIKRVYSRNKVIVLLLLAICFAGLSCTLLSGIYTSEASKSLENDAFHVIEYTQASAANQIEADSISGDLRTTGTDPFLTFQFSEPIQIGGS